jgi:hypothetical protein
VLPCCTVQLQLFGRRYISGDHAAEWSGSRHHTCTEAERPLLSTAGAHFEHSSAPWYLTCHLGPYCPTRPRLPSPLSYEDPPLACRGCARARPGRWNDRARSNVERRDVRHAIRYDLRPRTARGWYEDDRNSAPLGNHSARAGRVTRVGRVTPALPQCGGLADCGWLKSRAAGMRGARRARRRRCGCAVGGEEIERPLMSPAPEPQQQEEEPEQGRRGQERRSGEEDVACTKVESEDNRRRQRGRRRRGWRREWWWRGRRRRRRR